MSCNSMLRVHTKPPCDRIIFPHNNALALFIKPSESITITGGFLSSLSLTTNGGKSESDILKSEDSLVWPSRACIHTYIRH
jgi:hypothetical protein